MANILRSIGNNLPFLKKKKKIPTEYIPVFEESVEELANSPEEPGVSKPSKKPYRVKILRAGKAEDMDAVRSLLPSHDLILIFIGNIKDIEEVRRGISKVKVACARLGGEIVALDTRWLMVTSKNIEVKKEI
jgi:SepF-like predicted cell division protein (DUF552 family)